jgi:phytoene dehydrogenase-like protein
MSRKTVLIIGGGPAGLSAGSYCRMAGLEPIVFERHSLPGGLCTAWKRKGYTIDGCVHFIMGSGPGSSFHELWRELGVFDEVDPIDDFHYHDDFFHFRYANGNALRLETDLSKLEASLCSAYPGDAKTLRQFVEAVESLDGFSAPLDLLRGWKNTTHVARQALPYLKPLRRWQNTSIEAFSRQLRSRELREAFLRLWYPDYNMLYILLIMGWLGRRLAGYPQINSLGFSKILEKKMLERGGEVHYSTAVTRIVVESGRAQGVELESGEIVRGDHVIAAAASPETLGRLLPGARLKTPRIPITQPLVHVSLGSSYDFSGYESAACGLQLELEPRVEMAGEPRDFLLIHVYNFAHSLAPEGKTLVKAMFPTSYFRWSAAKSASPAHYAELKERDAQAVIEAIERYFPGFRSTVDMIDVATPVTFRDYTANQEGSLIAWGAVAGAPMMLPKTVPGIDGLLLAGHGVMPGGGVPQAALSARQAVQWICRREKIPSGQALI